MPLALLCLGLTLLGALQTQAQYIAPSFIPAPFLSSIPMEAEFQDDQFQGKWYVVGQAGNYFWKEAQGDFKMYSTTYELKADHSYNITSNLLSDKGCQHWIGTFFPSSQPGQYNLSNSKNFPNIQSYTMQVVATDYRDYAIVFFKKTLGNREYYNIKLYGRAKGLRGPLLKSVFILYAGSLGLTNDQITFSVPVVCCFDD